MPIRRLNGRVAIALAVSAGGAIVASAPDALAATVDCTTIAHPVYIAGGTAAKPYLQALAGVLGKSISLLYSGPTACVGLEDVAAKTPQTESSSWSLLDPVSGKAIACTGSGGTPYPAAYVDIGVSGAYPSSCVSPTIDTTSSTFNDFHAAIEAYEISVPYGSSQNSITADAAYVVFGWGGQTYTVSPWNVPADVWTRGVTSAVQLLIADAIKLDPTKWLTATTSAGSTGPQVLSSESTMATTIATATAPDSTIGILGSGGLDPVKSASGGVKPLAFQAAGQDCAYYADSDVSHFDKINVRQGRYDIWGPTHFLAAIDSSGNPQSHPLAAMNPVPSAAADVQTVISYLTHSGADTSPPFPKSTALTMAQLVATVQAEANANFVPVCAMQVARGSEDGPQASYQPNMGCGCFFESVVGKGTTLSGYCASCGSSTDCKNPAYTHCNFGYCEAQ